ncbi:MAG TPA: ribosome-associated translation inhibitor RaiA [Actinomycetota bacterium]|nr:ribosome-associated translation inhibitor RaiA [Actinomycetota bacterium]
MDLVLKARGVEITDGVRRAAEHKLRKIERLLPEVTRIEVELVGEPSPRVNGGHRVEVACQSPHRTFRAEAGGRDVEAAIDEVVERLEHQIARHRGKLHDRWTGRVNRLQSGRTSSGAADGSN